MTSTPQDTFGTEHRLYIRCPHLVTVSILTNDPRFEWAHILLTMLQDLVESSPWGVEVIITAKGMPTLEWDVQQAHLNLTVSRPHTFSNKVKVITWTNLFHGCSTTFTFRNRKSAVVQRKQMLSYCEHWVHAYLSQSKLWSSAQACSILC